MDDVQTSKTICTVSITRKYDSKDQKDKDKYKKYGDNLDAITQAMVNECVTAFVDKISPHEVVVKVTLEAGESQEVKDGNNFASEGEYADAIRMYKAAVDDKPKDAGALYNMGVCYEAMGRLVEAEKCYDRALAIKPEKEFIRARRRVRVEAEGDEKFDEATIEENRRKAREAKKNGN
jgi:tetratricopeptide (TPR) repeat protein